MHISRETQQKVNLVWHDDGTIRCVCRSFAIASCIPFVFNLQTKNTILSYNRRKFWHFEPSMSAGPLTDTVISLNLPMVTAVNYARENFMMEFGLSDMLATVEVGTTQHSRVDILIFFKYRIWSVDIFIISVVGKPLLYLTTTWSIVICHA